MIVTKQISKPNVAKCYETLQNYYRILNRHEIFVSLKKLRILSLSLSLSLSEDNAINWNDYK